MPENHDIERLDPNFSVPDLAGEWQWHPIDPYFVQGQAWPDETNPFQRLPRRAQSLVREDVWILSQCSTGLTIEFSTHSPVLAAQWQVGNSKLAMDHMPATGVSGLDLYCLEEDGWQWAGAGRPTGTTDNAKLIFQTESPQLRRFRLYLPLYNSLTRIRIGVKPGSFWQVHPPVPPTIVLYGTSIVQGGCASRPGMGYSAILERKVGRSIANLGFSGNGRAEPEVAKLLGELSPEVFLIDCLPNVQADVVEDQISRFLEILLSAKPDIPIAFVDDLNAPACRYNATYQASRGKKLAAMIKVKERFQRAVDAGNLQWFSGSHLLGEDGEGTVDGVHPTDLGFLRIAEDLARQLPAILPD